MTNGYLKAEKTFLMRKEDINKHKTTEDVNNSNLRVMINPGGTYEKFALEHLNNSNITVHSINEEIPGLISKGIADTTVTEAMEGLVYINEFDNLVLPLYKTSFTEIPIGTPTNKDKNNLLNELNDWLQKN